MLSNASSRVSPVLVAVLFHAPGLRWLAKRRLTAAAFKLNLVALAATGLLSALGGLERGAAGAALGWAAGHALWSITLATLVHRGVATRP